MPERSLRSDGERQSGLQANTYHCTKVKYWIPQLLQSTYVLLHAYVIFQLYIVGSWRSKGICDHCHSYVSLTPLDILFPILILIYIMDNKLPLIMDSSRIMTWFSRLMKRSCPMPLDQELSKLYPGFVLS